MPISITFYSLAERQPEHLEEVVWMKPVSACGAVGFDPRWVQVEYSWSELNEDGLYTGTSYCYSEDTEHEFSGDRWRLDILFDGCIGDNKTLWCDVDEYFEAFEEK